MLPTKKSFYRHAGSALELKYRLEEELELGGLQSISHFLLELKLLGQARSHNRIKLALLNFKWVAGHEG